MQQCGKYTLEQQVNFAYRNLRPEYRRLIRRKDFTTLPELMKLAAELDKVAADEKEAAKPGKRPEKKTEQPRNSGLAEVRADYDRETCCWRCGQRGHRRQECRRASKLFCSYCGTTGRTTRECNCNPISETRQGAANEATEQTPRHQRLEQHSRRGPATIPRLPSR